MLPMNQLKNVFGMPRARRQNVISQAPKNNEAKQEITQPRKKEKIKDAN